MKRISSTERDLLPKVPQGTVKSSQGNQKSSLKVRRSLALLGLSLSVTTTGILINQQSSQDLKATPVAQSPQTLTDAMAQNQDRKYELARAAIASGSLDSPQGVVIHEVREDETLWQITQMYQVDAAAIAASNNISSATNLLAGTKLVIPPVSGIVHKVKPGDTLQAIAKFYRVSEGDIVKYTSLKSPEFLSIDQPLVIPGSVTALLKVREDDAKSRLIAERDRLKRRLDEVEGRVTLVSHRAADSVKKLPKYTVYHVQNGDTIETIARRYGISQTVIAEVNKIDNPHWLELDQELRIPIGKTNTAIQTVAYLDPKPSKVVPQPFIPADSKVDSKGINQSNNSNQADQVSGMMSEIKVSAASPMVMPASTTVQPSSWNGLIELAGGDLSRQVPSAPAQEQPLQQPLALNQATAKSPVAPEPNFKLASLFLVAPEKAIVALIESPKSLSVAEAKPSVVAAATISNTGLSGSILNSSPSLGSTEQNVNAKTSPVGVTAQPVAEPPVQMPRFVAALKVPAIASIERAASNSLADIAAQPVAEPSVPAVQAPSQLTKVAAATPIIPNIPGGLVNQEIATSIDPNAQTLALLPESEARMTSLEVIRLETEIEQLAAKVREAEVKAAQRQAKALRIAAATITPDRRIDSGSRVLSEAATGIRPELPKLAANSYLPDASEYALSSTGFIWPAQGMLTSGFGFRWGRVHQGIDIAAPVGTPIWAAASGTVVYAGWNDGGYGNMVDIRHPDGTITRYGHLSAIYVKEGQSVGQSQVIAAMGSTGFSTGPHLHFEVRPQGGRAVNPMGYLARR